MVFLVNREKKQVLSTRGWEELIPPGGADMTSERVERWHALKKALGEDVDPRDTEVLTSWLLLYEPAEVVTPTGLQAAGEYLPWATKDGGHILIRPGWERWTLHKVDNDWKHWTGNALEVLGRSGGFVK